MTFDVGVATIEDIALDDVCDGKADVHICRAGKVRSYLGRFPQRTPLLRDGEAADIWFYRWSDVPPSCVTIDRPMMLEEALRHAVIHHGAVGGTFYVDVRAATECAGERAVPCWILEYS